MLIERIDKIYKRKINLVARSTKLLQMHQNYCYKTQEKAKYFVLPLDAILLFTYSNHYLNDPETSLSVDLLHIAIFTTALLMCYNFLISLTTLVLSIKTSKKILRIEKKVSNSYNYQKDLQKLNFGEINEMFNDIMELKKLDRLDEINATVVDSIIDEKMKMTFNSRDEKIKALESI